MFFFEVACNWLPVHFPIRNDLYTPKIIIDIFFYVIWSTFMNKKGTYKTWCGWVSEMFLECDGMGRYKDGISYHIMFTVPKNVC